MIEGRITGVFNERLGTTPSVVLPGPRQVSKATLAHMIGEQRASLYPALEVAPEGTQANFYRTADGAEIDLLPCPAKRSGPSSSSGA